MPQRDDRMMKGSADRCGPLASSQGQFGRRSFVAASLAASAVGTVLPARAAPRAAPLDQLYAEMEAAYLRRSPEHATSLGIDHGANAAARGLLDQRSHSAIVDEQREQAGFAARLKALDTAALSEDDRQDVEALAFDRAAKAGIAEFPGIRLAEPYAVTQRNGAYQDIPQFLVDQHEVSGSADAEAYLARMAAFADILDQETERVRGDAAERGVLAPDFTLRLAARQLRLLRDQPADRADIVANLAKKAKAKGLSAEFAAKVETLYASAIVPALDRQITELDRLAATAGSTAGLSRVPGGERLYAAALRAQTTTDRDPAEMAEMGQELLASLHGQIEALLHQQGMSKGKLSDRIAALRADPAQSYPATEAGAAEALADATRMIKEMRARLPSMFGTLPRNEVVVRRIPPATEQGAAGGFYDLGSIDGTRPGTFYINLAPGRQPERFGLPTLVYHEAIPGHHMHASIQQESNLPLIRKTLWFGAFNEGWAHYAEQIADEMGVYEANPLGRLGYLSGALFRAMRLVVDTGLHAGGWSRDEAIAFVVEKTFVDKAEATSEVDRYCVLPGQACSYMLGRETINAARRRARSALGDRFDIRVFHDLILGRGSIPMYQLSANVDRWITKQTRS